MYYIYLAAVGWKNWVGAVLAVGMAVVAEAVEEEPGDGGAVRAGKPGLRARAHGETPQGGR